MDYILTVQKVQEELKINQEWKERYSRYIDKLMCEEFQDNIIMAQRQFNVPKPFQLYLPLSMAINGCGKMYSKFDLRFHGQSVATLRVKNHAQKEVALLVKRNDNVRNALLEIHQSTEDLDAIVEASQDGISWSTHEDANTFRRIFTKLEEVTQTQKVVLRGQPEHDMESYLLKNYAKKSTLEKELVAIQPVTMCGSRAKFQMPTPIKASKAKDGICHIQYAKQYGGGIDILARVGKNTKLAILELKDENKATEPPEKAIQQAIAYATFIQVLLRSGEAQGAKWWNFFGFSGMLPKKLTLKVIIVMPNTNNAKTDFVRQTIPFAQNGDQIQLGYIYRQTDTLPAVHSI